MVKTSLPPGFRFHPTDVELMVYYLKRKVLGKKIHFDAIAEVEVFKNAPWDLPDKSCLKSKDLKWYFFCAREKKYASGARMKRATEFGYWKATGKDRPVQYNDKVVGMIKTLIFHQGKPPNGDRTNWVMHEYMLNDKDLLDQGVAQDSYVLTVVFQKDGIGPRNGAQYGAPFNEKDWSDNDEHDYSEFAGLPFQTVVPAPQIEANPETALADPTKSICNVVAPSSCMSDSQISSPNVLPSLPVVSMNNCEVENEGDDLDILLSQFVEEYIPDVHETERHDKPCQQNNFKQDIHSDDFFNDLDYVLADIGPVGQGGSSFSGYKHMYPLPEMLPNDDSTYLELLDLDRPLYSPPRVSALDQQMLGDYSYSNSDNNNNAPPSTSTSTNPVNHSSTSQNTFGFGKSDVNGWW
ncbi:hypothetical protein ACFE04_015616 [Oxalis oulophora]